MKIEIIPAVLPRDFSELKDKLELIKDVAKTAQIDVCDGQFVPTATWPYKRQDDSFEKILREEDGLPGWEKLVFEIDLMVNYPERIVDEWVTAGATRIIIHVEAKGDIMGTLLQLKDRVEIGIALGMETPVDVIEQYKEYITSVQLMGIDNIGLQGQAFDMKVVEKVKAVKDRYPDLSVSVDGGVSLENASLLIAAGANRLVVGSAIFKSDNPIEAVGKFKRLNR
jgi:ribulose-phosphate 3-epimerase